MTRERRKHRRVRARGIAALVHGADRPFSCQVEDLSEGGLFLRTDNELPKGTQLRIDLVKPGARKALRLEGVVAGTSSGGLLGHTGLGVQLVEPPLEAKTRLMQMLREIGAPVVGERPPVGEKPPQRLGRPAALAHEPHEMSLPHAPELDKAELQDMLGDLPVRRVPPPPPDAPAPVELVELHPEPAPQAAPPPPQATPTPLSTRALLTPLSSQALTPARGMRAAPISPDPHKLMMQIQGLLLEMGEAERALKSRDAEIELLREQLEEARSELRKRGA